MRKLFLTLGLMASSTGVLAMVPTTADARPPWGSGSLYGQQFYKGPQLPTYVDPKPARDYYYGSLGGADYLSDSGRVYVNPRASTTHLNDAGSPQGYVSPSAPIYVAPSRYWGTSSSGFYWNNEPPLSYTQGD